MGFVSNSVLLFETEEGEVNVCEVEGDGVEKDVRKQSIDGGQVQSSSTCLLETEWIVNVER